MAKIDVSIETNERPLPPPEHPNTCPRCQSHYRDDELQAALWVCGHCGYHFPMRAHDRIGWPSTWTVQLPQRAIPQPNFVPVRPRSSRITQRSGVSGGASTV